MAAFAKVMELNLLSLSSVKSFASAWEARQGPLHVLINNAGIFSMSGNALCIYQEIEMQCWFHASCNHSYVYFQLHGDFQEMGMRNICKLTIWHRLF
mgnify:FL=1